MRDGTQKNIILSIIIRAAMVLTLLAGMLSGHPATVARAAGTISLISFTYTQDFDILSATGTSSIIPNGWDFTEGGTNANTLYTAGTGSNNTGDTYSFGAAATTDRAFGSLRSGALIPVFGAQFTNDTGVTINSLEISYTGEEWRLGATARTDQLDFQLSTSATSLITGTWSDYNSLDFVAPTTVTTGAKDGNAAANRTAISDTLTGLNIANGSTFWIRWQDFDVTSADDGLAVDDFSLTAGGQPTVATLDATTVTATGTTLNGTVNANNGSATVTFEYGLTTAYELTDVTAAQSPVSGLANTPVSAAVSGLTPNTTYHYRTVGVNTAGTTYGLDRTFSIPALSATIATEVHNTAHTPVTVAALGDSLYAKATVTANGPAATGSVTFFAFNNPSCSGTGTDAGMVGLVSGGVAEPSLSTVLTINGLSFRAHYNGDSNYPAVDGDCQSVSTTSYPTALNLSTSTSPQDGALLTDSPSSLAVQFSMDVLHGNPLDNHSAEYPDNYLLVSPGANSTFDTQSCGPIGVGGLKTDDTQIAVNSVSYDPSTFIAVLTVNHGTALPRGVYRLFICGTTSITNPAGTTFLNNHTSDTLVTFTVITSLSNQQTRDDAVKSKKLPATGFAPNVATLLPAQPADKAYADEDMRLEIPVLSVNQPIVGVPWLGNNIGYLQGTAFPTWNGNSALTGHVTNSNGKPGPFASLGNLAWGDHVIIHAWGEQYVYEVRSVSLWTNPNSTSVLTKHEEPVVATMKKPTRIAGEPSSARYWFK